MSWKIDVVASGTSSQDLPDMSPRVFVIPQGFWLLDGGIKLGNQVDVSPTLVVGG